MPERTLICLHGFTHNGRFFEKLARKLTKTNWKILCPTFFGRAEQTRLNEREYNYKTYVDYLEEITSNIKDFSLLGSSMGGIIAMMYINQNPNKVKKLILNDVGEFISSKAIMDVGKKITFETSFPDEKAMNEHLKREFEGSTLTENELNFVKEIYTENLCLKYDPKVANAFWRKGKQIKIPDFDMREMWDDILKNNPDMQVLIIRGKNSEFLTADTAKNMQKNNNINLTEIENVGHLPLFLKDKEIKLVENFINA